MFLISHLFLVFLLLNLNMFLLAGYVVSKDTWLQTVAQQKRNLVWSFSWNFSITDIFQRFYWNPLHERFQWLFLHLSCGVWRQATLPIEEWKKTLWRSICLEMLHAVSVTKKSQLKITWSKLRQPSMDISWYNLSPEITFTKFKNRVI